MCSGAASGLNNVFDFLCVEFAWPPNFRLESNYQTLSDQSLSSEVGNFSLVELRDKLTYNIDIKLLMFI